MLILFLLSYWDIDDLIRDNDSGSNIILPNPLPILDYTQSPFPFAYLVARVENAISYTTRAPSSSSVIASVDPDNPISSGDVNERNCD
jgi:hypothetical protein